MVDKLIPHVRLTLDEAEIAAATDVLRSGYLAMGPKAAELEVALSTQVNQTYGAVVSSGTTALHLALLALGVKKGDEVILPAYSCQALLNAVLYVEARPRLVDINLATFNIDPVVIERVITPQTKAIIVPHMFGLMADIAAIKKLGVPVIEDCAMGIGAAINDQPAGSFGDLATFSFYATKMITGGEGGMIVSSNEDLIEAVRDLREYDKKKNFVVRYNYKMSDLNAAIALSQLRKLPEFIDARKKIAERYQRELSATDFILPAMPDGYRHGFARFIIRTDQADRLRNYLKGHGVGAGKGVVFGIQELWPTDEEFPNTNVALATAVSIPIYPTLSTEEQNKIISLLLEFN